MHLCFSCISYLSFGTEIAGETKTQPCLIDLNQQQRARSIYNLMLIKITGESVKFIGRKYIHR